MGIRPNLTRSQSRSDCMSERLSGNVNGSGSAVKVPERMSAIPYRLREVRRWNKLTTRQFATRLKQAGYDVSAATVSSYEREDGTNKIPAEYVVVVAREFKQPLAWLVGYQWDPDVPDLGLVEYDLEREAFFQIVEVIDLYRELRKINEPERIARFVDEWVTRRKPQPMSDGEPTLFEEPPEDESGGGAAGAKLPPKPPPLTPAEALRRTLDAHTGKDRARAAQQEAEEPKAGKRKGA